MSLVLNLPNLSQEMQECVLWSMKIFQRCEIEYEDWNFFEKPHSRKTEGQSLESSTTNVTGDGNRRLDFNFVPKHAKNETGDTTHHPFFHHPEHHVPENPLQKSLRSSQREVKKERMSKKNQMSSQKRLLFKTARSNYLSRGRPSKVRSRGHLTQPRSSKRGFQKGGHRQA